jgi:hypothetical protein
MYKLTEHKDQIIRTTDNTTIPFAPENQDFVEYQKWLSKGNTPTPADEVTE